MVVVFLRSICSKVSDGNIFFQQSVEMQLNFGFITCKHIPDQIFGMILHGRVVSEKVEDLRFEALSYFLIRNIELVQRLIFFPDSFRRIKGKISGVKQQGPEIVKIMILKLSVAE